MAPNIIRICYGAERDVGDGGEVDGVEGSIFKD